MGVCKFALQAYAQHGIANTASDAGAPAREKSEWFGVALGLEGGPLPSAHCIPPSKVSQISAVCIIADTDT